MLRGCNVDCNLGCNQKIDKKAMSIGERIKELRGNMSRDEFASLIGSNRNTIQRYETYERIPKADFIEIICEKFQVRADWLVLGIGPKSRSAEPLTELDQAILTDAIAALEEALAAKGRVIEPGKKAEIITEIYQLISEDEQKGTTSNIARILKLAV